MSYVEYENKCPHCGKESCIPDLVIVNVEYYGDKALNAECVHCHEMLQFYLVRSVKVISIRPTKQPSDF